MSVGSELAAAPAYYFYYYYCRLLFCSSGCFFFLSFLSYHFTATESWLVDFTSHTSFSLFFFFRFGYGLYFTTSLFISAKPHASCFLLVYYAAVCYSGVSSPLLFFLSLVLWRCRWLPFSGYLDFLHTQKENEKQQFSLV